VSDSADLTDLARSKMERVLGQKAARELLALGLAELKIDFLRTPEELLQFALFLRRRDGFEGAVGGLLGVQAAIRGAKATK
jgi:hypothetical protein